MMRSIWILFMLVITGTMSIHASNQIQALYHPTNIQLPQKMIMSEWSTITKSQGKKG